MTGTNAAGRGGHGLGVACGLAAGAWLGLAEAPTKLVTVGYSPFLISLGMVAGVFVARWTLPMALKGTGYIWRDIREKPHLVIWAILAGMLWAVANTLTVFAIRDVGISVAFPLWNVNSLVGLLWGWLLFDELRGSAARQWGKVLGGALAIVAGACLIAYATAHRVNGPAPRAATLGILAALGAGALWGTMYIPYRKAYLSGMNPLSFVTVFTFGEMGMVLALAAAFEGGLGNVAAELAQARPALFWLFLGGFCWVVGDLFQQYAAKYIGIARGIPLSNTNQLWGLAWGALVFGELAGRSAAARVVTVAGSAAMIVGAVAISLAAAPEGERAAWKRAAARECERYGLDARAVEAALRGEVPGGEKTRRRWWEAAVCAAAAGVFAWLASAARRQAIAVNEMWAVALLAASVAILAACGAMLWRRTRFE